jgi:hypothetical protein
MVGYHWASVAFFHRASAPLGQKHRPVTLNRRDADPSLYTNKRAQKARRRAINAWAMGTYTALSSRFCIFCSLAIFCTLKHWNSNPSQNVSNASVPALEVFAMLSSLSVADSGSRIDEGDSGGEASKFVCARTSISWCCC